jgi:hypothetical protein
VPPHVEYSLTRHGESLKPILKLMSAWGNRHRARYGAVAVRSGKPASSTDRNENPSPLAPLAGQMPRLAVSAEPIHEEKPVA